MEKNFNRKLIFPLLNLFLGVVFIQSLLFGSALAQKKPVEPPSQSSKHILFLYSYSHGSRGMQVFDDGFLTAMETAGIKINDIYFEYLDLERNKADQGYRSRLADLIIRKYRDRNIGVIITIQPPALHFLQHELKSLAPEAPAIILQSPKITREEAGTRRFLSKLSPFDINGTLARALELFPQTKRVVFVTGSSEADRKMAALADGIVASYKPKLEFEYTTDLSVEQLLKRVGNLPPHTIIVFTHQYNKDATDRVFVAYEVEKMITKAANAPVFGLYDFNLLDGGIGGSLVTVKSNGESTGRAALDLMTGTLQLTQPVTTVENKAVPMFDWQQIQRWGGNAANLPSETIILNRPPTLWEQYKLIVIGTVCIISILSLLIILLMVQKNRRSIAEKLLQKSEERFRQLVEQAPEAIVVYDVDQDRLIEVNKNAEKLFGCSREELLQKGIFSFYSPEQPDKLPIKESMAQNIKRTLAGKEVILERAIHNALGQDLICEMRLVKLPSAENRLIRNSLIDITERKRAEEQILTSLKEKEILLKEIHHRVRNNLTTIASILSLQSPFIEDKKSLEFFKECENRVRSMSKIHTKLYQSQSFAHIDFGSYLRELSQELFLSYHINPEAIELDVQIKDISLDINTALPLGLLLTELITNSLKYAFPGGKKGKLLVGMQQENNQTVLTVADDGVGFPENIDYQNTKTLGLQLVGGLVQQLDGMMEMRRGRGTVWTITFPVEK